MNPSSVLMLALAGQLLMPGVAQSQYTYVTHPSVLVRQGVMTEMLPSNPLRVFVYCVIASPKRGEPFAPSYAWIGNVVTGVRVEYPDRAPQVWGSTSEIWVFSDQVALISCTEFLSRRERQPETRDLDQ
jgi:hypothetical protein